MTERLPAQCAPAPAPDPAHALTVGRRVVRLEAQALGKLVDSLDESFMRAVGAMFAVEGRVVVSGMGKSGHVGRKIAATLASTGTPAQFVHPAEASHGDLGMVTVRDLVLMLSNSGETPELGPLITHTRRFNVPLVAVAAKRDSTLMRAADIAITLPDMKEACPMGLAPTSSTTATLALGDALAVALMDRRDFTPAHFRAFHPGGTLGARLVTAQNLMHGGERMPLRAASVSIAEAIDEMEAKGFGIVGLVDDGGALAGVITDGDLRRNICGLMTRAPLDIASRSPHVLRPTDTAGSALALMQKHAITCLFVVNDAGAPCGVLNIHDCLRLGAL